MISTNQFGSTIRRAFRQCKSNLLIVLMATMLIAALSAGCSTADGEASLPNAFDGPSAAAEKGSTALFDEGSVMSLYESAIRSVVEVEPRSEADTEASGEFDFDFYHPMRQGSGFVIDDQGHILTNYHVVGDASRATVTLHDGSSLDAEVFGTSPGNDVALLKADPSDLGDVTGLPLGNSGGVRPGQMAIALGSPFGLDGSITVGVISGVDRSVPGAIRSSMVGMLQTDAAINPGNSGGPLLNSSGEVIGINTAIEASATGIGFAIPIDKVKSLLPTLLEGGEMKRPWLGVRGADIDEEMAGRLDLPVNSGVYVVEVLPDTPAEAAGLREGGVDDSGKAAPGGDAITAVDGQEVAGMADLIDYLMGKQPGDQVSLSVQRGGESLSVDVELGEWPDEFPAMDFEPFPGDDQRPGPFDEWDWDLELPFELDAERAWLGIRGVDIDEDLAGRLNLPDSSGVYVVEVLPDSPAEAAGLRESGMDDSGQPASGGDAITAVDGQEVIGMEDLTDYLSGKKPGDRVSLSVQRGGESLAIDVELGEWPGRIFMPYLERFLRESR